MYFAVKALINKRLQNNSSLSLPGRQIGLSPTVLSHLSECHPDTEGTLYCLYETPMYTHPWQYELIRATVQCNIVYKATQVPRGLEVGVEWWVIHTTVTQKTRVCVPCESKCQRFFFSKLKQVVFYD